MRNYCNNTFERSGCPHGSKSSAYIRKRFEYCKSADEFRSSSRWNTTETLRERPIRISIEFSCCKTRTMIGMAICAKFGRFYKSHKSTWTRQNTRHCRTSPDTRLKSPPKMRYLSSHRESSDGRKSHPCSRCEQRNAKWNPLSGSLGADCTYQWRKRKSWKLEKLKWETRKNASSKTAGRFHEAPRSIYWSPLENIVILEILAIMVFPI